MTDQFVTLRRGPLVVATLALAACAPTVADIRTGVPRPPRDPACSLDVLNPTDMATIMRYDQIGVVRLANEEAGTSPMSPEAREIVRPRACAMGGNAISVMASGDIMARTAPVTRAFAAYIVWAKKAPASAAPQKF
jgi:hypothetical protein